MTNNISKIIFIFFLFFITSCAKRSLNENNEAFLKQYGSNLIDVKKQIQNNIINDQKMTVDQYKKRQSLDINRYRYGNYDKNSKIFFPTYFNKNFPNEYPVKNVNFNNIQIPKSDAFNIKTTLEKTYPLVNTKYLQENIRQSGKSQNNLK